MGIVDRQDSTNHTMRTRVSCNGSRHTSLPDLGHALYLLIKVDVDREIVYNQEQAEKYAENHCNSFEYALADWYYPDDEQYPYIAK